MDDYAQLLFLALPVLTTVLSVPMVMGKVPPNPFYGFRTRKTLSDRKVWYEANRLLGINLIVAAFVSLCGWVVIAYSLEGRLAVTAEAALFGGATAVASIYGLVQLRRL